MFTPRSRILVFVCDIQERFRPLIHKFTGLEVSAATLLQATAIFQNYHHTYHNQNSNPKTSNHPSSFPYAQITDVYVTEQYPKALGKTSPLLQSFLYPPTVGASSSSSAATSTIASPLPPTDPLVCRNVYKEEKLQFSMVTRNIHEKIKHHQSTASSASLPTTAILFGMETHVCIQQTALDLRKLGIDVILPVDAISSQREVDRKTALHFLQSKGCTLTTTESLIFDYMKGADYPEFKAVSKLMVKYGTAVVPEDRLDFY